MNFLSQQKISNKTVTLRVNLDVQIMNEKVVDTTLVNAIVPTLLQLTEANNKVVILSHRGNMVGTASDELSMMGIRFELARLLGKTIKFVSPTSAVNSIKYLEPGDILMFENLAFHKEEFEGNEEERLKFYTALIDNSQIYVNDAFGVDESLTSMKLLESKFQESYIGLNYEKEITKAKLITENQTHPSIAILGGRLNDIKYNFIQKNIEKFDTWLFGGELALDLIAARGSNLGKFISKNSDKSKALIELFEKLKSNVILPVDHMVEVDGGEATEIQTQSVDSDTLAKDIGPKTLVLFRECIESAESILWCGPMGVFEEEDFNIGTESIGEFIALSASRKATKIACGQDTLLAISQLKVKHKRFTHLSVGGVKFLELV